MFTVELDVYAGPYDLLLTLILKEELEVFEVPLTRLVELYRQSHLAADLERDTEFTDSATALVLLKSRLLSPAIEAEEAEDEAPASPEELADRLASYLKVRRAAEELADRISANAGYYPSAIPLAPRNARPKIRADKLTERARRVFSRAEEPPTTHLGPITLTLQELSELIESALCGGPRTFDEVVHGMDRLRTAVAFAATLSLCSEGRLSLHQKEPLGGILLEPRP